MREVGDYVTFRSFEFLGGFESLGVWEFVSLGACEFGSLGVCELGSL